MRKRKELWIQEAILRPGALTHYVKQKYGRRGFVKHDGRFTIKVDLLQKLAKKPGKVGRRARLALTLRKIRR